MPVRAVALLASLLVAGLGLTACGGGDERPDTGEAVTATGSADASPAGDAAGRGSDGPADGDSPAGGTGDGAAPADRAADDEPPAGRGRDPDAGQALASRPPASWTATCPTATTSPLGCRAVLGRVLSIQSYDPDGDGDLHVIAVGGDVTGPGVTVFDVRPALRPERDPEKGEYVTGAGPIFRGSLRQRQIQVDEFRVWRP